MTRETTLAEIMTTEVITVRPDMAIEDAAGLLWHHRISGAPVVDATGRPVGLLDDTDLLTSTARLHAPTTVHLLGAYLPLPGEQRRFNDELKAALAQTVEELMRTDLPTLNPSDTVEDAASVMRVKGVGRVGVVDAQGRVVGIVTRTDLVRAIAGRSDGTAGSADAADVD